MSEKPKKKVGLKDIAKEVGVSIALVSYVLNNQKEGRISKEVAEKIRRVARQLNYQPNQIAKSLKTQKSHTLALLVADIANPFYAQLARIIEDEAKRHGYTIIIGSSDENPEKLNDLVDTMANRQIDGLIIAAVKDSRIPVKKLEERHIPFVLIDRYYPEEPFSHVVIDNYKAVFDAVSYLIGKGRKRIGFITARTELFHLAERSRGYFEALQNAKIPKNEALLKVISPEPLYPQIRETIVHWLADDQPIDALFFSINSLALNGLKVLKELGTRIPEEVAVIAFDEVDLYDLYHVPITFIRQPLGEMGQKATELLIAQINNPGQRQKIFLNTQMILKESSG